jgi:Zn-dependent protease with chaperone function
MRVALLAVNVGLAAAAAGYAVCALIAVVLSRRAMGRGSSDMLAARLLPTLGGLLAALVLVVPAFVIHEPAQADERPGVLAVALAAAGLLLAGSLARRAFRAWQATRGVLAQWEESAQPLTVPGGPTLAFRIAHPFPVVAVVGVLRPRLFVARSVLHVLTPGELSAVLEHEAAHVKARDNIKRWLMACAPSIGWRGTAVALEKAWESAAEREADRSAHGALDLASALVKTARMALPGAQLRIPAAAFHGGGDVASRVQDLVAGPPATSAHPSASWTVLLAAIVGLLATAPLLWPAVYAWAEAFIHLP